MNKFKLGEEFVNKYNSKNPITKTFWWNINNSEEITFFPPFKIIGMRGTDTRYIKGYDFPEDIIHFEYLLSDRDGKEMKWEHEAYLEECLLKAN